LRAVDHITPKRPIKPNADAPKEKFHVQDDCSDRRLGRYGVSGVTRPSSSRGRSDKRAIEVQQRGPESMALAKHQLHHHRIFFFFGETDKAKTLS
jgi:hypothetical protein